MTRDLSKLEAVARYWAARPGEIPEWHEWPEAMLELIEQLRKSEREKIIEAFKAGVQWCRANGADRWIEQDYDAGFYADTGVVREHGGLVVHCIRHKRES